jgi:hypothetical protein
MLTTQGFMMETADGGALLGPAPPDLARWLSACSGNRSLSGAASSSRVKKTPAELVKDDHEFSYHIDLMLGFLEAPRSKIVFLWGMTAQEASQQAHI